MTNERPPAGDSDRYGLAALTKPASLLRLAGIGTVVFAIAAAFAGTAGWLSPGRLDPARMIDDPGEPRREQVEERSEAGQQEHGRQRELDRMRNIGQRDRRGAQHRPRHGPSNHVRQDALVIAARQNGDNLDFFTSFCDLSNGLSVRR